MFDFGGDLEVFSVDPDPPLVAKHAPKKGRMSVASTKSVEEMPPPPPPPPRARPRKGATPPPSVGTSTTVDSAGPKLSKKEILAAMKTYRAEVHSRPSSSLSKETN